jgi:hypothetical protein
MMDRTKLAIGPIVLVALSCLVLLSTAGDIIFAWAYDQLRYVDWKWELGFCIWPCMSIALSLPTLWYLHKMRPDSR